MSAQPDHTPVTPSAPAPGAPADLLAQLRADRRASMWVPAFEREWAAALEESGRTFSLAALYEVVQDWQVRLAHAPAVDAFVASGYDDSEFIDMAELRGKAFVTALQPYAIRLPAPAAKVLNTLPEYAGDTVRDAQTCKASASGTPTTLGEKTPATPRPALLHLLGEPASGALDGP